MWVPAAVGENFEVVEAQASSNRKMIDKSNLNKEPTVGVAFESLGRKSLSANAGRGNWRYSPLNSDAFRFGCVPIKWLMRATPGGTGTGSAGKQQSSWSWLKIYTYEGGLRSTKLEEVQAKLALIARDKLFSSPDINIYSDSFSHISYWVIFPLHQPRIFPGAVPPIERAQQVQPMDDQCAHLARFSLNTHATSHRYSTHAHASERQLINIQNECEATKKKRPLPRYLSLPLSRLHRRRSLSRSWQYVSSEKIMKLHLFYTYTHVATAFLSVWVCEGEGGTHVNRIKN